MGKLARVTVPELNGGSEIRNSALGMVPEILNPYLDMFQTIWHGGTLSPSCIEIARLRNARNVACVMCMNSRYDLAREDGLSEEKVSLINDDFQDSDLSDREKLVIEYTDQYLLDPARISESLKERMCATFTPAERVQLSMAIVAFNCLSRCAVALGGMPEDMPVIEVSIPT